MNIVMPYEKNADSISSSQEALLDFERNEQDHMNDDIAKHLMTLVGSAIEEWAICHGMEKMPKRIIFRQALGIMNAWSDIVESSGF